MQLSSSSIIKVSLGTVLAVVAFFVVSTLAHAEAAPSVTNQIQNSSNNVVSTALVGSSVHNVVRVASSTSSAIPQGTVDFSVYANTSCSGSPSSTQNGVALVNGFATSSASSVTSSGISYKTHYSGDVNNIAADSQCTFVTATSNSSTISATLSTTTSVLAGSIVHQSSTLSNVTANASGTVAYTVYSNSSCSTPVQGAGVRTVTNGIVPDSDNVTFNNPGTYYFQAVYSGDQNNSAATTTCANGILTVTAVPTQTKNSPTITTTLSSTSIQVGSSVHDSAVLNGETSNATGTVSYKVYSNNSCTTLWANAGSQSVTSGLVPDSAPVLFNIAGTYYWQVTYSGDQNNNAATSTCTSEVVTVSASGTTPPVSTTTNSISGQVYNDLNKNGHKDAGEPGLSGFKINLYNSANFNGGTYDSVFKTATTDANGNYAFNSLADGTYSVEQLKKTGWKQNSDDYPSVAVSSGTGKSAIDFAEVAKKNKNDSKDNGKHKKDCSDAEDREHASTSTPNISTSTHGWFKFDSNKGLHQGWFKGKGNQGKNKHSDD